MLRRTALGTTALLAALGLAGCSLPAGTGSQSEQPSSQAESTPSQQDSEAQVDQPKDLQAVSSACDLLKPEQLQELGLGTEPKPDESYSGESSCDWQNDNGIVSVTPKNRIGAQQMYENAKAFGEYHPGKVQGYPVNHKDRQSVICSTDVGVSDSATFRVDFTRATPNPTKPEMQDPCGFADTIAAEVLENIPNA